VRVRQLPPHSFVQVLQKFSRLVGAPAVSNFHLSRAHGLEEVLVSRREFESGFERGRQVRRGPQPGHAFYDTPVSKLEGRHRVVSEKHVFCELNPVLFCERGGVLHQVRSSRDDVCGRFDRVLLLFRKTVVRFRRRLVFRVPHGQDVKSRRSRLNAVGDRVVLGSVQVLVRQG